MFPDDVWQMSRWSWEQTEWFVPNSTTDGGTISFRWIKDLIVLASLWYFRVHREPKSAALPSYYADKKSFILVSLQLHPLFVKCFRSLGNKEKGKVSCITGLKKYFTMQNSSRTVLCFASFLRVFNYFFFINNSISETLSRNLRCRSIISRPLSCIYYPWGWEAKYI